MDTNRGSGRSPSAVLLSSATFNRAVGTWRRLAGATVGFLAVGVSLTVAAIVGLLPLGLLYRANLFFDAILAVLFSFGALTVVMFVWVAKETSRR